MTAYLSVISAIIRPEIKEKISIGLLLIGENRLFMGFSKNKLKVVRQLLPEDVYRGIRFAVNNFRQTAVDKNKDQPVLINNFTVIENLEDTVFTQSFLAYLSNYKNNVISVSNPKLINLDISKSIFETLFQKMVDEQGVWEEPEKKYSAFSALRNNKVLRERFNFDFELNQELFPNLIVPVRLDMVGKNKEEIFVKTIDLEKRTYNISNDVSRFYFVKNAIPNSQRFIISKEPPQNKFPKQYQIWKNLQKATWFEYIDFSEINRLEEYALQHGVNKLISHQSK